MSKDSIISNFADEANNSIHWDMRSRNTNISIYWEHLPELPNPVSVSRNSFNGAWIVYPYDKNLITEIDKLLTDAGWDSIQRTGENDVSSDYDMVRNLYVFRDVDNLRTAYLSVAFDDAKPGSTCKRKVIGTSTVEKKIYDFSCEEE